MNRAPDQTPQQKRSNIALAIILGVVALLAALTPLFYLNRLGIGG